MMRIINPIQVLLDTIHKQLEDAPSRGEGLARAWLTALIDSRNYDDGSFPEYLGNPDTGFALQFDRIYHEHKVAFEFNGPQHDHPTKRYNAATVAKQKRRDLHRRQICKSENITLIELTAVDLSKEGMLSKIAGTPLPLRELVDLHIVTDYLENLSRRYQEDCIYAQL